MSLAITGVFVALFVRVIYVVWFQNRADKRPPGPRPIPLLGNAHQLPIEYQERVIWKWEKKFGDLIYARFFQTHAIMINSMSVAQDLLEKRGANYSDRPAFMYAEMLGCKDFLTLMPYGDEFHTSRGWSHGAFTSKSVLKSYEPILFRELYSLLADLVDSPQDFVAHFARFNAAIITDITYGYRVESLDDPYVRLVEKTVGEGVEEGGAASMLVDFIPILRHYPTWMPKSGWKRKALSIRSIAKEMVDRPYNFVKHGMESGTAQPSFVSKLIEQLGEKDKDGKLREKDEKLLKWAASTIYVAAVETTQTVLTAFILAMVRHPRVLAKAHEEMDRVVGRDRLPDFSDQPSLPYLECVIKETLRWHPPLPLAVPHVSMKEDEYRGYVIPARTMVLPNIWGMSRDEENYPNPEEFFPERFEQMSKEEGQRLDPHNYVFGFGRRVCVGRDFADLNIYLVIANLVATMDISKSPLDPAPPPHAYKSGAIHHILPFRCSIRPRSQEIVQLIAQLRPSIHRKL